MDINLILTIGITVIAYCFGFGVMAMVNEKIFEVALDGEQPYKAAFMAFFWPITLAIIVCVLVPVFCGAWLTDRLVNN